jgi:DNA (cytosine-5)-methyltransferase 1
VIDQQTLSDSTPPRPPQSQEGETNNAPQGGAVPGGSEKLRVLDLFSGIGGFSLGLERTGGFQTVAFCEIDPFCRRVLAKHWPNVRQFEDVTKLRGEDVGPVDVICGGFPCQGISIAGRGLGLSDPRSGLWSEFARLIEELQPRLVIIENSPKLRARGLQTVLSDLDALGFDADWDCIPASHVGAPHRRDRIWIVAHRPGDAFSAYADMLRLHSQEMHFGRGFELRHQQIGHLGSLVGWSAEPDVDRVVDGLPSDMDIARIRAVGNAVVPQIPELIGRAILEARRAAA